MIPNDFIQTLLSRVDIVEVIDRYVPLKKAGANYVACCPFHSEKTPSFSVSPTKQFYHCFGCGAHGTAIGFLMEHARQDVSRCRRGTGPRRRPRGAAHRARRASASGATKRDGPERAAARRRAVLPRAAEGRAARDRLPQGRGLTGEIAARFGIGYAPDAWQGLAAAFPNYDDPALDAAGLVISGDGGKRYDRFRDRVMFPIHDSRGRVIGFGGRVLGDGEPKYLNSPETPVFSKGRELYGLYLARNAIRDAGTRRRRRGLHGRRGARAARRRVRGGHARHRDHADARAEALPPDRHGRVLLRRRQRRAARPRGARWRTRCRCWPTARTRVFLFLPDGEDPDDFVRKRGKAAFEQAHRTGGAAVRVPAGRARGAPSADVRRGPRRAGRRRAAAARADRRAGAGAPSCAGGWPSSPGLPEAELRGLLGVAGRRPARPSAAATGADDARPSRAPGPRQVRRPPSLRGS